jgi:hypothetical protein
VLAFSLPQRAVLLRVVRVRPHRLGESPILEELDFAGDGVPSREALEALGPAVRSASAPSTALSPDTRFFAFVMQRVDWQRAGFQKVQTIGARAGDEQAPLPGAGISWAQLAERFRSRSA